MDRTLEALRRELGARAPRWIAAGDLPRAAVALVLAPSESRGHELLLVRRAQRAGDPWSGHMALPGGRQEPGDEDLLATARRETFEEVGIELPSETLLGALDDLSPRSAPQRIAVRPFVFGLARRPRVIENDEIALHVWTPLDELATSLSTTEIFHLGALQRLPSYVVGEHVVWGMTQRILEPFLELAASARGAR
jgi:8-oxo-dGTP pyrophosphatase MutT (NUDIX family)